MRLFKDKATNSYSIQVNKDSGRKHQLADYYSEAGKVEGSEELDQSKVLDGYKNRLKQFQFIWDNSGMDVDGTEWKVQDMYSVPDAPILLPKVISTVVREAMEPMMIGVSLLQRINFSMGQTILLPAASALSLAELDIPEGGEYPEAKMTQGGAAMVANIGKSGIAVKISDEMVRYSQVDVISMHLRAASRALARHKEVKIFNMVGAEGLVYFDNADPVNSVLGVTHGRGFNGAANGAATAEDLFDLWGHLLARGFSGDTMLVHPLTYTMFLKDPNMRAMFFNANTNVLFASWRGQAKGGNPWALAAGGMSVGKIEDVQPDTGVELRNQAIDSAPILPGYLSNPMTVIVSPFVSYDPIKKLTDIMIFDQGELGVLLVDEDPTTEEWDDPARDIRKIKIRERYALGILNEGQAVALIKNAVNVDNMITSQPAVPQINIAALDADGNPTGSGGLEEINERVAILP
jgi:hypothetical protein